MPQITFETMCEVIQSLIKENKPECHIASYLTNVIGMDITSYDWHNTYKSFRKDKYGAVSYNIKNGRVRNIIMWKLN